MTWIWISGFVLACTGPLAAYTYLIEVRGTSTPVRVPTGETTRAGEAS